MTIIGHSEPHDIGIYGNPNYYFRYDSPRVRELLAAAERAGSEAERIALLQEVAKQIAEDAVNVWVFSTAYLVAARRDLYGFWESQPTPSINMTEVFWAR